MPKGKHLTLDDRQSIQVGLHEGRTFQEIAREIGKDPSTISKEIRNHRFTNRTGSFNPCSKVKECSHLRDVCSPCTERWGGTCRSCRVVICYNVCSHFSPKTCRRLISAPYVCNGCRERHGCRLERYLYDAKSAQKDYEQTLSQSRTGFAISYDELKRIDDIVSPLIRQGQSIHHICQNNKDLIMCDEKSIYNYIDAGLLSVGNLDLPRKVRYRVRKKKRPVLQQRKVPEEVRSTDSNGKTRILPSCCIDHHPVYGAPFWAGARMGGLERRAVRSHLSSRGLPADQPRLMAA